MELETTTYNFKDPVEVLELCKEEVGPDEWEERGSRFAFLWEDLIAIKEYPYEDEWEVFNKAKCFLRFRTSNFEFLVQESYDYLSSKWKEYRNL